MGATCGSRNTISYPSFVVGQVRELLHPESKVKVSCLNNNYKLEFAVEPGIMSRVRKKDKAYCYCHNDERIITLPSCLTNFPLRGKVTRPNLNCYEFLQEDGKKEVFPSDIMLTSFEIHNKSVTCVVDKVGEQLAMRVESYNPFIYYNVTADPNNEKRNLGRHRQKLSEFDDQIIRKKAGNAQINHISKTYSGFRRVRRDGNSLYRSVFVLYLEHLSRKSTSIEELDHFIGLVDSKNNYYALLPSFEQYGDRVSALLHKLREIKSRKLNEELVTLQWMLQDRTTDTANIYFFRMIIANYIAVHYQLPHLKRFVVNEIKEVVNNILTFGVEAEGIVKYAIPDLLHVVIVQQDVSVDTNEVFETYYAPVEIGNYPALCICKSHSNGYHILYSIEENAIDGYDFQDSTYYLMDLSTKLKTEFVPKLYNSVLPSALHAIQT